MKSKFVSGQWNVICDRCGIRYKSSQVKKEWTGLYVCKRCWEPRHEQDFLKGVKDDPSVPFARPEAADSFVSLDFDEALKTDVPDGTFDGNL